MDSEIQFLVGSSTGQLTECSWLSLEQASKRGRESKQVAEPESFLAAITFAIFYLFEGSPVHIQGQGITESYKYQEEEEELEPRSCLSHGA